jgi:hypothetical protein
VLVVLAGLTVGPVEFPMMNMDLGEALERPSVRLVSFTVVTVLTSELRLPLIVGQGGDCPSDSCECTDGGIQPLVILLVTLRSDESAWWNSWSL